MPSIDTDTRLIMTILFVGAVSGINVFFYSSYGFMFPYAAYTHAVLFGILTVGAIMIMKAIFDMALNDTIENFLLERRIDFYWRRKAKEEDNRKRVRESMRNFQQTFHPPLQQFPQPPPPQQLDTDSISPTFLSTFNE